MKILRFLYTDYDDIGEVLHSQIKKHVKSNSEKDRNYEIGNSLSNDVFINTTPYMNTLYFGEDFYKSLPQPHHHPVPPPHHVLFIINSQSSIICHTVTPHPLNHHVLTIYHRVCNDEALAAGFDVMVQDRGTILDTIKPSGTISSPSLRRTL